MRCRLKYSRVACGFLSLAVAATLALVTFAPFPDAARALAYAFVVGGATLAHRRLAAPRELRLDCRRAIEVREESGWRTGEVRDGSFVAPWLTIIRWRPEGARFDRTLVVLPDMAGAEMRRRIRVVLRWA